jgi:hypothetical protein
VRAACPQQGSQPQYSLGCPSGRVLKRR